MTTIETEICPECGAEATCHRENGTTTYIYCEECEYCFDCDLENMGDDEESICRYPDGWTCNYCGEGYFGIKPHEAKEGTVCVKCVNKIRIEKVKKISKKKKAVKIKKHK